MSRHWALAGGAVLLFAVPAAAQDTGTAPVYGPLDLSEFDADPDDPEPSKTAKPCETEPTEDGVIVVCRELEEEERYRDPLPAPVASDRVIISEIETPPCWVVNTGGLCLRGGWVPPPVLLVDVSDFPEKLSEEHRAAIVAVESSGESGQGTGEGRRIPIDISEN